MGMGSNGKSLMGIEWEWELVTKLGMGMGRNGNRLHGNGREWECTKPFPGISSLYRTTAYAYSTTVLSVLSSFNAQPYLATPDSGLKLSILLR